MGRIKMIALDMDGTLLNSKRQVSEKNRDALHEALDKGIIVALSSGRSLSTIIPIAKELGVVGPVVSCNGAYTVDKNLVEVTHHGLCEEARDFVLDFAEGSGVHTNFYSREKVLFATETPFMYEYSRRTGVPTMVNNTPTYVGFHHLKTMIPTKIVFMDTPARVSEINDHMRSKLPETFAEIALSEIDYIEFLPKNVNKGMGVMEIAAHLGISQEETAALGDYYNDFEMIQWAGYGGAVGNALPEVKAAADIVVSTNNEDGAAEFIKICMGL